MRPRLHAPDLSIDLNVQNLCDRQSPYWNILEYCRHIGIEKRFSRDRCWMARVRCKNGNYKQARLGKVSLFHTDGMNYEEARKAADHWFDAPEIKAISSHAFPVGVNCQLKYRKSQRAFTIGDAFVDFVEWKRISAAKTYFETTLSLINHHIIPRLGEVLVSDFDAKRITAFCTEVLEAAPKRGNQTQGISVPLASIDHETLRKRKKTLNTLLGLIRLALQMAWENDDIPSEKTWRRIRRLPHADAPRQFFLTRKQAKMLISACRPDLAKLVLAALYTGCRVSELANLKARDVGGHVFGIYVAPMKSYRSRYVILPEEGMSFFLDQIEGLEDEDLVFRMRSGRSWSGCHKHLFKEAVRLSGLPDPFVFHGLRHTYASQLVQAGSPLAVVARQLGHSNTDTVSRTYGHLCCETIEAEVSMRFAPLKETISDPRLASLRASLQNQNEPAWSWPKKNYSKATGSIVELLSQREDELRS